MSGTIDHNVAVADVVQGAAVIEQPEGFFFRAIADDKGFTEIAFRKDAKTLFAALVALLTFVNSTFDKPREKTSDFINELYEAMLGVEAFEAQKGQGNEAGKDSTEADGEPAAT